VKRKKKEEGESTLTYDGNGDHSDDNIVIIRHVSKFTFEQKEMVSDDVGSITTFEKQEKPLNPAQRSLTLNTEKQ